MKAQKSESLKEVLEEIKGINKNLDNIMSCLVNIISKEASESEETLLGEIASKVGEIHNQCLGIEQDIHILKKVIQQQMN